MPEKRIKISLPEDKQIHIDRDIKRFLPSAGEAELKVLLYSLCEREFSLSEAAEFLQLDKSDIESAVVIKITDCKMIRKGRICIPVNCTPSAAQVI